MIEPLHEDWTTTVCTCVVFVLGVFFWLLYFRCRKKMKWTHHTFSMLMFFLSICHLMMMIFYYDLRFFFAGFRHLNNKKNRNHLHFFSYNSIRLRTIHTGQMKKNRHHHHHHFAVYWPENEHFFLHPTIQLFYSKCL